MRHPVDESAQQEGKKSICFCVNPSVLQCEPLTQSVVGLLSRPVLHIPIGFAPLPIIHNFEGASLRSAFMCMLIA